MRKHEYTLIPAMTRLPKRRSQLERDTMTQSSPDDTEDSDFRAAIGSEVEDQESSPGSFEIVTYPADFTLEILNEKMARGDIVVPKFQRKFIWKPKQSSRLIESFLLGIPVPPIFLFSDSDDKLLVVDGQQRLKSIASFFKGLIGDPAEPTDIEFKLQIDENSPYSNKTYADLEATDLAAFRRLNNSVLRSFVIKQLKPKGRSGIYHVFERLNTGGTSLVGQEIRNCIFHGSFNELLIRLNTPPSARSKVPIEWRQNVTKWRKIVGRPKADARLRDVELILRFFAMHDSMSAYKRPLKDFLSDYMEDMRRPDKPTIESHRDLFQRTVDAVHDSLGAKPFHIKAGLNAAVFDAVFLAFAAHKGRIPDDIKRRFQRLKRDKVFFDSTTAATTNTQSVKRRIRRAKKILFGA
ncbi:MAG TPA: DUF262 domain-containing protein [Pirellulales bacterium]|nr:DUF262 domain-containing protein [Pirellulales bacterium]